MPAAKPLIIPCQTCNGTGKTPLPDHLQQVLSVLPKSGAVVEEVQMLIEARSKIGVAGVNNRLTDLVRLGLVRRQRDIGKRFRYFRA